MMNKPIRAELRATVRGDMDFDDVSRALYATDASIYQIAPLSVVLPRDEADIVCRSCHAAASRALFS